MNNGKICVSVCAETADEMLRQIKRAEDLADVIEIRFDCLNESELNKLLSQINELGKQFNGKFLITFRPLEQGGKRPLEISERLKFWQSFFANKKSDNFYIDVEFDFHSLIDFKSVERIASYHNFLDFSVNFTESYEFLKQAKSEILKIAVQTKDICDAIGVWNLLEKAKSDNKQIIPIAMGEAGKWTRILGLAHGAFMIYASLETGKETAPGQVSAKDLIEVYRAKDLTPETEVYGILGDNTGVSMSPYMHNAAFKFHDLNAVFVPLQATDLDEFMRRMVKPETREIELNFRGFSVTIPHKQTIIKHLDFLDETAKEIGAVNTVKITDGKLYGFNTDAKGFTEPLKNCYGELKNVKIAVLGAGGAARACAYALKKENADVTIFARDGQKARNLADDFQIEFRELANNDFNEFDILVNTTPLGMKGKAEDETPAFGEQFQKVKLVYDLVYNPFETRFLKEADKFNVPKIGGLAMLIAQAMEQQKIWTDREPPMKEMSRAVLERLQ